MNLLNIFKRKPSLSSEEIQQYLSGNMTEDQLHQFEEKMLDNDFNFDAVEGFESSPNAIADVSQLNEAIQLSTQPIGNTFSWGKAIFISTTMFAIIAGLYYSFTSSKTTTEPILAEAPIEIEIEPMENFQVYNDTVYHQAIEEEIKENIIPEITQEIVQLEDDVIEVVKKDYPSKIEMIEIETVHELPHLSEAPVKDIKSYKSSIKTLLLYNHIVVDYSNLYTDVIEKELRIGVAASRENDIDPMKIEKDHFENNILEFEYLEFLRLTMKHMHREKHESALSNFLLILDHYPDDANAQFYSGLCYFFMENYTDALQQFKKAYANKYNTFDQESKWFMALCYEETDNLPEARKLYEEITKKGEFYAVRAEEKMNLIHD